MTDVSMPSETSHTPARKSSVARRIVIAVLLVIFLGSGGTIAYVMSQYAESDALYAQARERFTVEPNASARNESAAGGTSAPLAVDFEALRQVNPDVVGWIYCEGTPIDYPVLKGADNDRYLHADYTGATTLNGSIFVDCDNADGFRDSNTIIYGHHMNQGSMFAALEQWADPGFYEQHPVVWLLTPDQDYQVQLFSGHHLSARSSMYDIVAMPGEQLDAFLAQALAESDFDTDVNVSAQDRLVMLSTCAYVFDDARYALHGKLVPVS